MKKYLFLFATIFLVSCGGSELSDSLVEEAHNPIYVTFTGHIEDSKMYMDCEVYAQKRADLLKVAEMMNDSGVDFNLQASYEWFMGVSDCETEDLMNHLVEEYDFEIDVHQEGASEELDDVTSGNNLADIRYLAATVTDYVTDSTGFQWDNPAQYDRFQYGEKGRLHDFTWSPQILTGGVSVKHTNGDFSKDMTSVGVWIPSGFTKKDFHIHDESEDARMVYLGSGPNQFMDDWGGGKGCHFTSSADFVDTLDAYVEPEKIYTYTVFVPQKIMFEEEGREQLQSLIDEFLVLADEGKVEFAHHTEVVEIWHNEYNSEPNIFTYDEIHPEEYSCQP